MNPFYNLPVQQHGLQHRVDKWNADESLWRKLAPKRRLRRKLLRRLGRRTLRELDFREHAAARPPDDCIGQWLPDTGATKSTRRLNP
jgi:hypothetical protein